MNSDRFAPEPSSNRNINININIDGGDEIEQNGSFGIGVHQGNADIGGNINGKIEGNKISINNQAFINKNKSVKAVNKKANGTRLKLELDGIDFESFINDETMKEAVSLLFSKASGDKSIKFEQIEKGSIKITLNGSPEGSFDVSKEIVPEMPISEQELEILKLLWHKCWNEKKIAQELHISEKIVQDYIKNMKDALNISSLYRDDVSEQAALCKEAVRLHLV